MIAPNKSSSLELGLTPSHVYSLWKNINRSLLIYAKLVDVGAEQIGQLEAMRSRPYEGKKPADVFAMAQKVQEALKGHIPWSTETPGWLIEFEKVGKTKTADTDEITPSAVFLISMQLLNGIVFVVVENTGWEVPVSDLYASDVPSDMTPSDVFGLVDLALRRIDFILTSKTAVDPSGIS